MRISCGQSWLGKRLKTGLQCVMQACMGTYCRFRSHHDFSMGMQVGLSELLRHFCEMHNAPPGGS